MTNLPRIAAILGLGLAFCGPNSGCSVHDESVAVPPATSASLIESEAATYQFGPVINKPGRWLSHTYPLVNHLDRDIELVDVINKKPCCGVINFKRTLLMPGDRTEVEIKLAVGGRFASVSHQAELVTDPPLPEPVMLRTEAEAVPEIRVVESDSNKRVLLVGATHTQPARYQLIATGTAQEPPDDLDGVEIKSSVEAGWVGPQRKSRDDRDFVVHTRDWAAPLSAVGERGSRTDQVVFQRANQVLSRWNVTWEVVLPVEPTPKMLVIQPGTTRYRIVLRSQDAKAFHVESVSCDLAAIEVQPCTATDKAVQTLVFQEKEGGRDDNSRGKITLTTNHPDAATIEIPVHILR